MPKNSGLKKYLVVVIAILILLTIIVAGKYESYQTTINFYEADFYSRIEKIVTARGTKVYLNNADPFDTSRYKGPELRVGDFLIKQGSTIEVYRTIKGERVHIGNATALEPDKSFAAYFFGWDW